MISRRNSILAVALAVGCAAGMLIAAPTLVRVIFGVPLVLLIPGYALTSALFARHDLRAAAVLLLSIALSLAVVIVGSFVLNWLPYGLTTTTWTVLLVGTTTVAGVWAVRVIPADTRRQRFAVARLTLLQTGLLALALVVTAAALIFARKPLPAAGIRGYTALWIVPTGRYTVEVGLESSELHRTSFRLEIRDSDGREIERDLNLETGERWSFRVGVHRSTHRVDARLFLRDSPKRAYRHVRLLLPPNGSSS